eukprot:3897293-Pleurochrysis_carterae.AAC.2
MRRRWASVCGASDVTILPCGKGTDDVSTSRDSPTISCEWEENRKGPDLLVQTPNVLKRARTFWYGPLRFGAQRRAGFSNRLKRA